MSFHKRVFRRVHWKLVSDLIEYPQKKGWKTRGKTKINNFNKKFSRRADEQLNLNKHEQQNQSHMLRSTTVSNIRTSTIAIDHWKHFLSARKNSLNKHCISL